MRTWNGLHPQNPITAFKSEIWPVVNTPGVKFVLAWVTSGANRPSDGVKKYAVQQAVEAAGGQAPVETQFLVLEDFTKELLRDVTPAGVEVTGEFIHSRGVDAQTQSLQGAISANVLGEWYRQHPKGLLDDNVRVALSHDSGVNAEIVRTLLEDPRNFWFFHKGVTALCETWEFSGANARVAPVTFRGLRIVDGAQTVSSIAAALEKAEQKGPAAVADMARAEVPVRFIKLEGREPGFGARITFTNNRANPITARDMLAMHDVQQRIRDDFALAFDWAYLIRADEDAPEEQDKCSVLEAVIAVACAGLTVPALVEAGADIEAIWPGPVTSTGSCSAPAPARPRSGAGSGHCALSGPSCRRTARAHTGCSERPWSMRSDRRCWSIWSEVGPWMLRQIYAVCSPTAPTRPEPRAATGLTPMLPRGLLARARELDGGNRAATGRPISRDALRDQMRIGRDRAGAIVAVVRAEMAAAEVKARQLRAA